MIINALVRQLHSEGHYRATTKKICKLFGEKLDFKEIKFPVKFTDIQKIEQKNFNCKSVFGYENKEKYMFCVSQE